MGRVNWTSVYWAAMSYCIFLHILFHLISKIILWGRHCFPWEVIGLYLKKVKISQSCLTLCDPMDYTVHGILQARILEWVAFPFSRGSSQPRDRTQVSHTVGGFFISWATREVSVYYYKVHNLFTKSFFPFLTKEIAKNSPLAWGWEGDWVDVLLLGNSSLLPCHLADYSPW